MAAPESPPSTPPTPPGVEEPQIKWKTIALIGGVLVFLWALAVGLVGYIGYWGVGAMGLVTVAAAGFGLYIWRFARKSRAIVDILKHAQDEEGRKAALERLRAEGKDGDALNALAQAQLLAREDPAEAMKILEGIDLKKAPALVQDDVRANLALMYLMLNRAKDARALADEIRLDRQPQAKAKALYAAVMAEAFARTGKGPEASKLLETFSAEDASYGEVRPMLYRARVYAFMAAKKRGLAKKAMAELAAIDPNMLTAFAVNPKRPTVVETRTELGRLAMEVLSEQGLMPKPRMKVMR